LFVGGRRPAAEGRTGREFDQLPLLDDHDVGLERQMRSYRRKQCRLRHRRAYNECAGGADIDDVVHRKILRKRCGHESFMPADVHAS